MTFEQFSDGTSFLHRADPKGKLISTGVLSLVIALSQTRGTALLGFPLAFTLVLAARLSWSKLLRRLFIVNSFNLLLCLILPLTYTGGKTVSLIGINLSSTGFFLALLITVKSNAVILLFISLLATSTAAQLGHGLQQLRLSPKLCLLLLFSYRYIALIQQELFRLQRAAGLRCFQPKTNLHTYRTYSYMLGMMLVRSWNRAARVQQAMKLRGFSGQFYSLYDSGGMRKSDLLLSAVLLLAGAGLVVIEILSI
ncbi:cobalt/nickel transport system permease protein [Candidatus Electrothrix marina]|uniref:Cobalt/nickel transport system permease protein n=2 Tax=Candidatus Electrothrix marina TaxID=1859130 RepID=A0A444JGH9_9BACT|nr:cobalt/nickel transport system permease protein [Candidatus Electrothrix marina]